LSQKDIKSGKRLHATDLTAIWDRARFP
jgi:hypothetical protein